VMSSSSSSHHQTLAVGQSQKESYCPGYLVSLFQNHLVNLKEQGVPSPDSDSAATRVECRAARGPLVASCTEGESFLQVSDHSLVR
jgi:hypothetical protein